MMGHWVRIPAAALALAFGVALAQAAPAAPQQSGTQAISASQLDAHSAAHHRRTRAAIKEVLARPEFADLHSDPYAGWRQVIKWLMSLLSRAGSAIAHLPAWLLWTIIAWMVLVLLAVLAHLIYTLWKVLGGPSDAGGGPSRRHRQGQLLGVSNLEFDPVYAEARRLSAAGDWPAATRYYYVAAILWLDRQGAIAFRPSKTNRDYIRELPAPTGLRNLFGRLTDGFERIAYAGQTATAATGRDMADTVEGLLNEPRPTAAN
jgi:hypothetical protein